MLQCFALVLLVAKILITVGELMNRKKCTFFVSSLAGGGAEAVCVNIANGLVARGWCVDLIILNLKNPDYKSRLSTKVNLVNLNVSRARFALPRLVSYLIKNKPEKILVFKYELIDLVIVAKKLLNLKLLVIARNISVLSESRALNKYTLMERVIKRIFGIPLEQVDLIINQSNEMQRDLLKTYPSLIGKSFVIHNPVSSVIEEYVNKNGLVDKSQCNYLLCVGRLEKVKAFHNAITSFSLITGSFPNLRLKIVGRGSLEGKLKELCVTLGVRDKVDFEGFQKNIIPYYEGARITILTSLYEGFPNVLIESIFLGTPIVSYDCPSGPREILDYGKWGKLVDLGDTKKLADALREELERSTPIDLSERANFFAVSKAVNLYEEAILSV